MTISNAAFVQGIYSHLRDYPEPIDAQTQDALTALAERTFATAEEAGHALAEFVERVQRSDKSGFKKSVQALFNQEIKRLSSAPVAEEPIKKRSRPETGNTGIGFLDLPLDPMAHIFSFLDPQSQGRAAQVCRDYRGAMRLRRIYDVSSLQPLNTPEFLALSSLFGISLPPPNPSSAEVSAACEALFANVPYILEGVKTSDALSEKEQKPFLTMNASEIVQDPSLLKNLLHTAYEISLVAPFLDRKNAGPELLASMTLKAKADAIRKHLKEKGDGYTELKCDSSGMLCLPTEFCSLHNLQRLDLFDNRLITLPPEIGRLERLRCLALNFNRLTSIPAEICRLKELQSLGLGGNHLTTIPAEIWRLSQLQSLDLNHNHLTTIPAEIRQLAQLRDLRLYDNRLTTIPAEIGQLLQLQCLILYGNRLTTIPAEIGQLAQLRDLSLADNSLISIPDEIWKLEKLQTLILSGNRLTSIPAGIGRLAHLMVLFLSDNRLTSIPAGIEQLELLHSLELMGNLITSIPDEIWRRTYYMAIYLRGNPLTATPKSTEKIQIII